VTLVTCAVRALRGQAVATFHRTDELGEGGQDPGKVDRRTDPHLAS
jgi:hypothetical protein